MNRDDPVTQITRPASLKPPIIIITVLTIGILAGTAGFLLGRRANQPHQHEQLITHPVQQQALSPVPTQIPGFNTWTVYRNRVYGFELKYPPTWSLIESSGKSSSIATILANPEALNNERISSEQIDIHLFKIPTSETGSAGRLEGFIADRVKETRESLCQVFTVINDKNVILGDVIVEQVTIAGVTAVKVRCNEEATCSLGGFVTAFVPISSAMLLEISIHIRNQEFPLPISPESLAIFSQILASIKFF